jgi:RimJ/RimL family protein N-acetyltransferase
MPEALELELHATQPEELEQIVALECAENMARFITVESLEHHREQLARPDVHYLTLAVAGEFAGYVILVLDDDGRSVELRRITLARPGAGLGKLALALLDEHVRAVLGRARIWLDVFDDNVRARRAYEASGYRFAETGQYPDGRTLLFYDKAL